MRVRVRSVIYFALGPTGVPKMYIARFSERRRSLAIASRLRLIRHRVQNLPSCSRYQRKEILLIIFNTVLTPLSINPVPSSRIAYELFFSISVKKKSKIFYRSG